MILCRGVEKMRSTIRVVSRRGSGGRPRGGWWQRRCGKRRSASETHRARDSPAVSTTAYDQLADNFGYRSLAKALHLVRSPSTSRVPAAMRTPHSPPRVARTHVLTSYSVVIPSLIIAGVNAWRLWDEHWEHVAHGPPLEEKTEYPYQNIRTKNYFWGDGDKVRTYHEVKTLPRVCVG